MKINKNLWDTAIAVLNREICSIKCIYKKKKGLK